MSTRESKRLFERAKRVIPGGVNSPVRAFGSVGLTPRFLSRGHGAHVWDADGNRLIDYVGSWGPLVLGHADPGVLRAIRKAAERGTSFGAPTRLEIELAEAIREALPSCEQIRMVSSGTEASMSALRLARAATGRSRVLKFEGCYHGHVDGLLVGAGSGVATLGIPGSPGVPAAYAELTVQAPYNDLAASQAAFERWGSELACVVVEPVAGNMGLRAAAPRIPRGTSGALRSLRRAADLRRGDHGLSRRLGRSPGALWRDAGSHLPRQDRRRRAAGGRLRRAARSDAAARAGGSRLPGGDALGQPAGDGGGPRDAAPAARAPEATRSSRRARKDSPRGCGSGRRRRGSRSPPIPWAGSSASSSIPGRSRASPTRAAPTRPASGSSSPPCSRPASTWRRPRSSAASSRSPTAAEISRRPSRRPGGPCAGWPARVEGGSSVG